MSDSAKACPGCGHPNATALAKESDSKQGCGCALLLLSIFVGLVSPIAGVSMFVIGIVLIALNTRFK